MFRIRIKELRMRHGWTQRYVAESLKISRVAYTRYEMGDREPDFEVVKKIADIFNVSIDYLLGKSDAPNPPSDIPVSPQTIITFGGGLGGQTYIIPDEKAERLKKLIEAAMPEILNGVEERNL